MDELDLSGVPAEVKEQILLAISLFKENGEEELLKVFLDGVKKTIEVFDHWDAKVKEKMTEYEVTFLDYFKFEYFGLLEKILSFSPEASPAEAVRKIATDLENLNLLTDQWVKTHFGPLQEVEVRERILRDIFRFYNNI